MMLPPERVFGAVRPGDARALIDRSQALLRQQRETWPMCRKGYESLKLVQTKSLGLYGYELHLQFNPGRIVSTGANVDPAAISQRRCFLCVSHLPAEQHAVAYGDDLLILCNPAPIFAEHFTISHREHRPQAIEPSIELMLQLSSDLSPEFCTFYNGPRCGASAPDHFHFQAAPMSSIPVVVESRSDRRSVLHRLGDVELSTLPEYGRTMAMLRSGDAAALADAFQQFIGVWQGILGSDDEPMMNVLCAVEQGVYRLVIFLRRQHRAASYFLEGDRQVMVSPAAVDVGGLVVTPREKEFDSLTTDSMAGIFEEVSAEPAVLQQILEAL